MDDIDHLLIEAACSKLATTASLYMDQGRFGEFAKMFVEDGEFVRPSTFPDRPLQGREEISSVLTERFKGLVSRHLCTNVIIDVTNENEASGSSFFFHISAAALQSDAPGELGSSLRSMGEYQDEYVRTPVGWRIKRRVGRFRFRNS